MFVQYIVTEIDNNGTLVYYSNPKLILSIEIIDRLRTMTTFSQQLRGQLLSSADINLMPHNVIANYTKRIIRMRRLENSRTVVSDAITFGTV